MSNLVKRDKGAIVKRTQDNNIQLEEFGSAPALFGGISDDPVLTGVINAVVGLGAFAGSIMIGGGIFGALAIGVGASVGIMADLVYSLKQAKNINFDDDEDDIDEVAEMVAKAATPEQTKYTPETPIPPNNRVTVTVKPIVVEDGPYSPVNSLVPANGKIGSRLIIGVGGAGKNLTVSHSVLEVKKVRSRN
jgi:hypothetical protein